MILFPCIYRNKDWLENEYLDQKLSTLHIGRKCGVSGQTIYGWLKKFNIPVRSDSKSLNLYHIKRLRNSKYCDKKWLRKKYQKEELNIKQIAKLCGVTPSAIRQWFIKYNIPRRSRSEVRCLFNRKQIGNDKYYNTEWLKQRYIGEKLSGLKIAKLCKVGRTTIYKWLEKSNIYRRSQSEALTLIEKRYQNKEWLEKKYIEEKSSATKISELSEVTCRTICLWLKKFNIPIRKNYIRTPEERRMISKRLRKPFIKYESKIVELYKSGIGSIQIAKALGISQTTVLNMLERRNIKKRENRKYKVNKEYFHDIDHPNKAYWLGFLMADGSIQKSKECSYSLRLTLKAEDFILLSMFTKEIGSLHPIKYGFSDFINGKKYPIVFLTINSKQFVMDLIKWGIIPRKTGKEKMPDIPSKFYPDFIRGVFDGDGCAQFYERKRGGYIEWPLIWQITSNKMLLDQINEIFMNKLGLNNRKISRGIGCYVLKISGYKQIKKIYQFLYYTPGHPYLERKEHILSEGITFLETHLRQSGYHIGEIIDVPCPLCKKIKKIKYREPRDFKSPSLCRSCVQKGRIPWNKGRKTNCYSKETLRKTS